MTATTSETVNPSIPPRAEVQAAALWTFVHLRTPRFASSDALQVVRELAPIAGEDIKALAKRLKIALEAKGIGLKYTHTLDAAARLLGHKSWHAGGFQAVPKPLQLRCHFPGFDRALVNWEEAVKIFGDYCEGDVSAGGLCLYHFEFTATTVSMDLPFNQLRDSSGRTTPMMLVQWMGEDHEQLAAAISAVENLRRRFEESGRALIDGLAAAQFSLRNPYPNAVFDDPLNSELVLVDVTPGSGYLEEISRGDEIKCFADLEELFERNTVYTSEGNQWITDSKRMEWSLITLRAATPAPRVLTRPLSSSETARLLRRYCNAVRSGRSFLKQDRVKRLGLLRVETLGVDVDWARVNLELTGTKLNRRNFQGQLDVPTEPNSKLGATEFAKLVSFLDGPSPTELIRKPKRSELVRLDDDGILRTFVSRIQDVIYEAPRRLDGARLRTVDEAVNMFLTALRLEVETTDGLMIDGFPRSGPYLIYANQGKALLGELKKLGLVAYAGLTVNVAKLQVGEYRRAGLKPLRFDRVLFLDIDFADPFDLHEVKITESGAQNGGGKEIK